MNWFAAGIGVLAGLAIAAGVVGYIALGNWIEDRWSSQWAVFYGVAVPISIMVGLVAGIICA